MGVGRTPGLVEADKGRGVEVVHPLLRWTLVVSDHNVTSVTSGGSSRVRGPTSTAEERREIGGNGYQILVLYLSRPVHLPDPTLPLVVTSNDLGTLSGREGR